MLCCCNWLQHLVNPFSEAMCDAANIRADRSRRPSIVFLSLVNFIQDIELPKWVFLVVSHVLYNVLTVQFVKVLAVLLYPGEDCGVHCGSMLEGFLLCELCICRSIG